MFEGARGYNCASSGSTNSLAAPSRVTQQQGGHIEHFLDESVGIQMNFVFDTNYMLISLFAEISPAHFIVQFWQPGKYAYHQGSLHISPV